MFRVCMTGMMIRLPMLSSRFASPTLPFLVQVPGGCVPIAHDPSKAEVSNIAD
jgi:hypothetical protein